MSAPFLPKGVHVRTVSELTQEIKELLEETYGQVWVEGEVSNLARPASGHLYFTLKDAQAQMRSVIWRGVAMRLRFELRDGLEIVARGRLSVYQPRGDYQFIVEEMQPKGIGALELALRQLREKLFQLGYFDPRRKKPLPRVPRRLALITSPSGAAVRDMLEILTKRWPVVEIWVCPVRVQGEGAAAEIAAAIRRINQIHQAGGVPIDVAIIGRGGGSLEDLWAFNEMPVAQAIHESRVPIVSAVGHEVDVTIADLVADVRALTPSEAATRVVPDLREMTQGLTELHRALTDSLRQRLAQARWQLDDLAQRRVFRLPLERIHAEEQRLDDWAQRLQRALRQRLQRAQTLLEAAAGRLQTLSPLNVLARGYSLTRREADRVVIRDAEQVKLGDRLVTTVQHGQIVSRVEEAPVAQETAVPKS
ncbi:MAG: exodeoxyribonuclease VII large subunit [Gemmataceae bacterium]